MGTRGSPIMPRDAVSRTANVKRNGGHKWVLTSMRVQYLIEIKITAQDASEASGIF